MQETVGSGITRPLAWRKKQLERLMALVEQHEQDVLKALKTDLGKPATEACKTTYSASVCLHWLRIFSIAFFAKPRP